MCLAMQVKMGITISVLDPTEECPASRAANHVVGSFRDAATIRFVPHVTAGSVRSLPRLLHCLARTWKGEFRGATSS